MGSKSGGDQTQSTEPWKEAQPYLKQGMKEAQTLYNTDSGSNPWGSLARSQRLQTASNTMGFDVTKENPYGADPSELGYGMITGVAGLTQQQQDANARRESLGTADPSANLAAAQGAANSQIARGETGGDTLQQTASGKFVGQANPYMEGMYQAAARPLEQTFATKTLPALAAQFSGAGAQGSPDHQYWAGQAASGLTSTLGDMQANMYGNAYAQERGLQQDAANQLYSGQRAAAAIGTSVDDQSFNRGVSQANLLDQAGQQQQGINQNLINQTIGTYDGVDNADQKRLSQYIAALNGNPAASLTQTSSPTTSNPMMGAAGGAMSGAAAGSMFGPYGMAAGAVGGGLLGYFGTQ